MCETSSIFSRINNFKIFPQIEYFYSSDYPINIKICRKNVPDSHKTGGNFQAGKPDRLRIMPGWHFAYMGIPTRFRSCRSLSFPLSFLVYRARGRILKIALRTVYKQTQERVSNFIKFFRKALTLIPVLRRGNKSPLLDVYCCCCC